jgi:hypothetical protein
MDILILIIIRDIVAGTAITINMTAIIGRVIAAGRNGIIVTTVITVTTVTTAITDITAMIGITATTGMIVITGIDQLIGRHLAAKFGMASVFVK